MKSIHTARKLQEVEPYSPGLWNLSSMKSAAVQGNTESESKIAFL